MASQRVVVVGAGVIGVTTAHALMQDGHEVQLLEAEPSAAQGSSQANGGFMSAAFCAPWATPALPRQAFKALWQPQSPLRFVPDGSWAQLRWLRQLWAQCKAETFAQQRQHMVALALYSRRCMQALVAQTGVAFELQERGVLQLFRSAPPTATLQRQLQQLQNLGITAQWLDARAVREREPGLAQGAAAPPLAGALWVPGDASGDCERFTQALLAWCQARGVRFEPGVRVEALEFANCAHAAHPALPAQAIHRSNAPPRLAALHGAGRRWQADAFVFATGVATARLLQPHLRVPVLPVKGYSVTAELVHEPADTEQGAHPAQPGSPDPHHQHVSSTPGGPQHAIIDDHSKLGVVRWGTRLRLAGMAEVVGHHLQVNAQRCEQLVRQYEALYGPLPSTGRSHWAGLRPMTPQGTPLVGATAIPGLYLNTGHGTYGWTLACGSARLLADVLAGRAGELDCAAYALKPNA